MRRDALTQASRFTRQAAREARAIFCQALQELYLRRRLIAPTRSPRPIKPKVRARGLRFPAQKKNCQTQARRHRCPL